MTSLKLSGVKRKKAFLGPITRMVRSRALKLCSGAEGKLVDVACGNGIFAAAMALRCGGSLKIFALDMSFPILREARQIFEDNSVSRVNLLCADACRMPFKKGTFDLVVCINTFVNLDDANLVWELIGSLADLCSERGRLIFDYRNGRNPLLKARYWLYRMRRRGPTTAGHCAEDYRSELAKRGLEIAIKQAVGLPFEATAFGFVVEARRKRMPQ